MEKVIIIAPLDLDIDDSIKALSKFDVVRVAPSPANFLHLCLGMLPDDPNDGETDAEDKDLDADEKNSIDDAPEDSVESSKDSSDNAADDPTTETIKVTEPIIESTVPEKIIGKLQDREVNIIFTDEDKSKLKCSIPKTGAYTSYMINELCISFWPKDNIVEDSVMLELNSQKAFINVALEESSDGSTTLFLGNDYSEIFK